MTPLVSLCLIVRDEAQLLPEFLQSVAGVWDELVAVDTGSKDETPRLLEAAGARVLHRAWDDDFAAARNFGLEHARGQWILYLDPDERPQPGFAEQIRQAAQDSRCGAATVRMVNPLPHGQRRVARLLRLFRALPEARFSGRVHEDVVTQLRPALAARGLVTADLDADVLHLGYQRARASDRDKKARDTALLKRMLQETPSDLYSHFKLLELARFWEDRVLWRQAAAQALPHLRERVEELRTLPFADQLVVLLSQGLFSHSAADQLTFLESAHKRVGPSSVLELARAECLERLGDARAELAFEQCLLLCGGEEALCEQRTRPLLGLARCALARGDLGAALKRADQALDLTPRDPEALACAVAVARLAGGTPAVAEMHVALARMYGDSAELWAAVADDAVAAGEPARAKAAFLESLGREEDLRVRRRLERLAWAPAPEEASAVRGAQGGLRDAR